MDRRLLDRIQQRVPLVRRPYAALAAELSCDESTVLARLAHLRGGRWPVVREIAGLFDAVRLGYHTTLAACAAPGGRLDAAGALVAGHPAVSHCYARDHRLNLWFTLTLGPDSRLGLDGTAAWLAERMGAATMLLLPSRKRFKLSMHVDAAGRMNAAPRLPAAPEEGSSPVPVTDRMRSAIRALQEDLPGEGEPFETLAAGAGVSVETLLDAGNQLLELRVLRRYGAVLHHRRAGLKANVLVAWRVSDVEADAAGQAAAALPAVSHCYLRDRAADWPYNLYTMVHGQTRGECRQVIADIAAATGLPDHAALWTLKEFKKARVRLLTTDAARWEGEHIGRPAGRDRPMTGEPPGHPYN